MRLLETETITLHEFLEPPEEYAILSHVWRAEEVLFHHIQDPDAAKHLRGYTKVASCCALARREGYKWAWIDTCCIDKTSSAELSESLNSMFAWYGKADVCYAYLDDVCSDDDLEDPASAFVRSKWFTRGWTLQELIAPTNVVFLSKDWSEIGTKLALAGVLEAITGVDAAILMAVVGLSVEGVSVGKRMAWAANRETTREEDRAYSLMGIFGINMPTIYGEGNQAFIRLQHEIIRKTSDHSIFAWNGVGAERERMGLLAPNPDYFLPHTDTIFPEYYADYVQRYGIVNPVPELSVTSYGIRMRLPIRPHTDSPTRNTYLAALACSQVVPRGHGRMHAVCLHLEHIPGSVNMYARARSGSDDAGLVFIDLHDTAGFVAEDLYIMEQYHSTFHELAHNVYVAPVVYLFFFHWDVLQDRGFVCVGCAPAEVWDRRRYATAVTDPFPKAACVTVLLRDQASGRTVAIILGIEGVPLEDRDAPDDHFLMWADAMVDDGSDIWAVRHEGCGDDVASSIREMYYNPSSKWYSALAVAGTQSGLRMNDPTLYVSKSLDSGLGVVNVVIQRKAERRISLMAEQAFDIDLSVEGFACPLGGARETRSEREVYIGKDNTQPCPAASLTPLSDPQHPCKSLAQSLIGDIASFKLPSTAKSTIAQMLGAPAALKALWRDGDPTGDLLRMMWHRRHTMHTQSSSGR